MVGLLNELACLIGNTPLLRLRSGRIDLFAKLEYFNLSGSIKDRPAFEILMAAAEIGQINKETTVIESSSGNMAMATICGYLGLEFIPVIDANVNPSTEMVLRNLCKRVEKITSRDETGTYLLNRINRVKKICSQETNMFWTNQYENENNYLNLTTSFGC
jgi:cysteine synthase A